MLNIFHHPDAFTVFIRFWPEVPVESCYPRIKPVSKLMTQFETNKFDTLIKYKIPIPVDKQAGDFKIELIRELIDLGFRWLPALYLFDRIKGKAFCIVM